MALKKLRVAIAGVGDCASFSQGLAHYGGSAGDEALPWLTARKGAEIKSPSKQFTDPEARERTFRFIAGEDMHANDA